MNLIVQDLAVGYRGREIARGISLQAAAGDCLLICGLNGSGKTTLLRTLAGLLPPVAGSFRANGRVVMVPTRIPRVKGFTVSEFLRLATGAAPADAARAIEQAGLPTLADRDISTLSDGQFQRACIATALCRRAAVILLDEPTAFLDYQAKEQILFYPPWPATPAPPSSSPPTTWMPPAKSPRRNTGFFDLRFSAIYGDFIKTCVLYNTLVF